MTWIIEAANDSGRRFFGPFEDEDEAMSWGIFNLVDDYEPEDWEQHELSLDPPEDGSRGDQG